MGESVNELQSLKAHSSDVTCCDFSADCILATGSGDKTVKMWEWKPGLGYVELHFSPIKGHKYGVTYLAFSPQGTMLASSSIDGTTVLWNARNGHQISKFSQVNGDPVRVCRFTTDSFNLVTGGDNGIVCVWDIIHRNLIRTIQHHEDTVYSIALSPDYSFLLTGCNLGVIKLYNLSDVCDTRLEEINPIISVDDAHDLGVLCCDFSSVTESDDDDESAIKYSFATSGNDHCLKLWQVTFVPGKLKENSSGCVVTTAHAIQEAHSNAITCVRYNQIGDLLCSSSMDKSVKVWTSDGACVYILTAHTRYVNCVAFSRDGALLCSGSNDQTIKIWDMTGDTLSIDSKLTVTCVKHCHFASGDLEGISKIQHDSDVDDSEIDETEMMMVQNIEDLHTASINAMEFSPDGKFLATGSGDKLVKMLMMDENKEAFDDVSIGSMTVGIHRYQVNSITFLSQDVLASCSLDGYIMLWKANPEKSSSFALKTMSMSSAGVRCIRKVNHEAETRLLAAYDDGLAALWSLDSSSAIPVAVYPEHADATTCCSSSNDGRLVCSGSHNGDFKLYEAVMNGQQPIDAIFVQDSAHDLGLQGMDFAPSVSNIPIQVPDNCSCHLLATCGNDCHAKIWKIVIPKLEPINHQITCCEWRNLQGHGSSVTSVKFPPNRADLLCTTSTDKQARIWSVYSGRCLRVLEHDSLVACCAFSPDGIHLATGCLSGQLVLWKLPQQNMVSVSTLRSQFDISIDGDAQLLISRSSSCDIRLWDSLALARWARDNCSSSTEDPPVLLRFTVKALAGHVTGRQLMNGNEEDAFITLGIDPSSEDPEEAHLAREVQWLRKGPPRKNKLLTQPPHRYLCPITHGLMTDPVSLSDGFTYERRAVEEWFISGGGKLISPMTDQPLLNGILTKNKKMKAMIREWLYEEDS